MTKDQRRSQTKKALLDALVICLKDQDFNDITTIRLVQTAGISRSSFYTHYKDKYEMIDSYQKELFHKLEYIFDKYEGKKEGAFLEIFEFLILDKEKATHPKIFNYPILFILFARHYHIEPFLADCEGKNLLLCF